MAIIEPFRSLRYSPRLVPDLSRAIAPPYDVISPPEQDDYYKQDPHNIIRFVSVNDLSVGRNPQEVLRVLDALQTDELCPCNWQKGQDVLRPAV